MFYVKLLYDNDNHYRFSGFNSEEMAILGLFLTSEVNCQNTTYKKWVLHPLAEVIGGNVARVEKEDNYVYLSDQYSEDGDYIRLDDLDSGKCKVIKLKMTVEQFIKILDDWEHKVCALKPQEVTIKYENDEFIFETKQHEK